jgi:hypothetical protein
MRTYDSVARHGSGLYFLRTDAGIVDIPSDAQGVVAAMDCDRRNEWGDKQNKRYMQLWAQHREAEFAVTKA